jgi:hypothetical protein
MGLLTILPDDYVYTSDGLNVCDENGFAIKASKSMCVKINDEASYKLVCNNICEERCKYGQRIGNNKLRKTVWLIVHPGDTFKEGTFVHHDHDNVYRIIKDCMLFDDCVCGELANDVTYDSRLIPKKIIVMEEHTRDVMQKITKHAISLTLVAVNSTRVHTVTKNIGVCKINCCRDQHQFFTKMWTRLVACSR